MKRWVSLSHLISSILPCSKQACSLRVAGLDAMRIVWLWNIRMLNLVSAWSMCSTWFVILARTIRRNSLPPSIMWWHCSWEISTRIVWNSSRRWSACWNSSNKKALSASFWVRMALLMYGSSIARTSLRWPVLLPIADLIIISWLISSIRSLVPIWVSWIRKAIVVATSLSASAFLDAPSLATIRIYR